MKFRMLIVFAIIIMSLNLCVVSFMLASTSSAVLARVSVGPALIEATSVAATVRVKIFEKNMVKSFD